MADFSFLENNGDDETPWPTNGMERRETDLVDERGRRIGFVIRRSIVDPPRRGVPPFIRWVAVTKDGEWVRNDGDSFHATEEAAEAWVEHRIRTATARYERMAAERGRFDFTRTKRRPGKRPKTIVQRLEDAERGMKAASDKLMGCGCALILLGLLLLSPFIAAALL